MKKMRLKKKNCLIALLILVFIIICLINPFRMSAINNLQKLGYSKESSKRIISLGLKNELLNTEYNSFIDKNINDENFEEDYYDTYSSLTFGDKINIDIINKLLEKKYTADEINLIINHGDEKALNHFVLMDKIDNISNYLSFDYAKLENIERYINYKKNNTYDYEDVVTYVNIGLDKDFYNDYQMVNEFSFTMLVNKYRSVSKEMIPNDLVSFPKDYCRGECPKDNKEVVDNFVIMANDLKKEINSNIYVNSAYRPYEEQEETYNQLTKLYGKDYDVAKAGFSEHQTGLAVDIGVNNGIFKGSKEEKWLKNNSYKYGFILRYDSDSVKITGYNEPWHFRYVGKEVAKDVFEKKITFDEYYVKFLDR